MWTDLVSQVHEKKATTAAEDWRKSVDDLASEKFVHMWKSHGVRTLTLLRRRVLTVCTGTGGNRAASAASLFSTRQRTRGRGARAFPPARRLRKRSAREHLGLPSWRIRVVRGAESLGVNVRPQTRPCTVTFRKTRFPLLKFVASFSYAYLSNGRSLRMIFFLMLAGVTGLRF